jgi:hypothetical protein
MVTASLLYLSHFVSRGWIPHDEGMLGQSAERVMRGEVPHVGYEEPYTGGLSWIYAQVFRVGGIELLHIRWVLFGIAIIAMGMLYMLLRRFMRPAPAALGAWVGLAWSFPNYFAGLPSWWLLTCALASLWALVRFVETRQLQYVAFAGAAAGLAIVIKQTGVYVFVAALLTIAYTTISDSDRPARSRVFARAIAIGSALFAAAILGRRIFAAEGLYLLCPVLACSLGLFMRTYETTARTSEIATRSIATALCIGAAVPIVLLLIPYAVKGDLSRFIYGAFVLPRKRLAYATLPMPPGLVIIAGIPFIGLLMRPRTSMLSVRLVFATELTWTAAVLLPVWALSNFVVYQLIWQSTRALVALTPVAISYYLTRGSVEDSGRATVLYGAATVLAWFSLNQFPYAAAIYFCYVTPLAVVAIVALSACTGSLRSHAMLPWAVMLLLFAVVSMNRSYLHDLGREHVTNVFNTDLGLPRAHLRLERADVDLYRRTVAVIRQHLTTQRLVAGPDAPELYFLTDTLSASGRLFDFFSESDAKARTEWSYGQVIVINHRPAFSNALTSDLVTELRRRFPDGQEIGRFEVRWR